MTKAMLTAMTEGRWKVEVEVSDPRASSRIEKAMSMKETEVMRKQKTMFPAVSIRAFPEGNFRGSTLWTARLHAMRVMLDSGSKMASAMVVKRDKEPEAVAP